jgi:hypothetical protein
MCVRRPPRLHKLLCHTNLPEPQLFQCGEALFVRNCARFRRSGHASATNFRELCNSDGLRHHHSKHRVFARDSGNVGTTNGLHAPTSGGFAAWLACGEILRNSADGAARFLNKATSRLGVVRIATTGKGVTIGTMVRSVTTGTTGRGAPTMTTNSRLM